MRVAIIGGGAIGLMSAWYLRQEGHEVVVLDKGPMEDGCSYGNAGLVVPSHFIPLAAPGIVAKGIRWMFNPESPFYIKPRLDTKLFGWIWRFLRSATTANVERSVELLRDYNLLSQQCYKSLAEQMEKTIDFSQRGLLMLYKSALAEADELKVAKRANDLGIKARPLSAEAAREMEPNLKLDIRGAVYYPGDAHLSPDKMMQQLQKMLRGQGVALKGGQEVRKIEYSGKQVKRLITTTGSIEADAFVLAAGSWSQQLTRHLALSLPLQAGKGYSLTLDQSSPLPRHPSILSEAKVAVTPMGRRLRFAGTMEIAGINEQVNMRRVKGILKAIPQYLPDFDLPLPDPKQVWFGLRPCSPDGLPYVGRPASYSNLIVACGHAMMGLSLAPATGLLVSQLIDGRPTSLPVDRMHVDRFA